MPVLANARYERFAQGIARGRAQHDAYTHAGFTPNPKIKPADLRSAAAKMARRPEIVLRIKELLDKQASRLGVTVDHLVKQLDEMYMLAKKVKHPAAGVGAVLAKGKLLGLVVDRAEIDATIRKPSRVPTEDKTMSMEEWQQKFAPPETLQ